MNLQEAAMFVARVQLLDNRGADRATIAHWQQTLSDIPLAEALEALVTHSRESTEYLMPAHIVKLVKRARLERAQRYDDSLDARLNAAPRPVNFDAMSKAWKDPLRFAREVEEYNTQLAAANLAPVDGETIRRRVAS